MGRCANDNKPKNTRLDSGIRYLRKMSIPPSTLARTWKGAEPLADLAYLSSLIRIKYLNEGIAKRHHKISRTH